MESEVLLPWLQEPATYLNPEPDQSSLLPSLISHFCCVVNVVFFCLGVSPSSKFYVLTFQKIVYTIFTLYNTYEAGTYRAFQNVGT